MGRRRRVARDTTAQGVIPLCYSTSDFEESKKNIIDFTEAIRSRNRDTNQRELSRDAVAEQFTIAVFREYATTDPRLFELLGQVSRYQTPRFGVVHD